MTTHRLLQLSALLDTAQSKARIARKGAANLARIGNHNGAEYFRCKSIRFEGLAERCAVRLGDV